jgi:hypothetical protein
MRPGGYMILYDRTHNGRRYIAATERPDLSMACIMSGLPTFFIKEKPSPVHGTLHYMVLWGDAAKQFTRRDLYR